MKLAIINSNKKKNVLQERHDPQFCKTYAIDILQHTIANELKNICFVNYFAQPYQSQDEVTPKHRAVLIDWINDISIKCKFGNQCLFMAVNIIDRFLMSNCCKVSDLQLIGTAALFIAGKYEEIYPPTLQQYVQI